MLAKDTSIVCWAEQKYLLKQKGGIYNFFIMNADIQNIK